MIPDFEFARYYFHATSGLSMTFKREYNPFLGRWANRDPIAEKSGCNLFVYCKNAPVAYTDPLGLDVAIVITPRHRGFPGYGHCAVLIGNDDDGWTYYSNSLGGDSNSGRQFPNLSAFYGAFPEDYSADLTSWFPGSGGDAGAAAAAQGSIDKGYNPYTNNCAHTCRDALEGAGIGVPEAHAGLTPREVFGWANDAGGQTPPQSGLGTQ
jgi:RHS repeat-associated protein